MLECINDGLHIHFHAQTVPIVATVGTSFDIRTTRLTAIPQPPMSDQGNIEQLMAQLDREERTIHSYAVIYIAQ